jgi:Putative peptidoglycan binding domain
MVEVRGARGRRRSGSRRLRRLHLILPLVVSAALALPALAAARPNPLAGRAMWIWEMSAVDGGNVSQIIATAHQYGIGTLMIKSSDGTSLWSQFNASLVAQLHAAGLRVCAWQYVYGNHPVTEAYMGAYAVRDGADCLLIDAESEYEGKYVSAQTYIRRLRSLIGYGYPLALAGFPYVDYHPAFPYSVFLGPGGAQYNAPQMYWSDIGVTTDTVFAHTYSFNLPYQRPIFPLGQVFQNPPAHQIVRFRQLSRVYGAPGISWWDWQEATPGDWTAISRPAGQLTGYVPYKVMADVGQGAQGDMVVWAQEHLVSAGYPIAISGDFGYHTLVDVEAFQTAHGLAPDGIVGQQTWTALLGYRAARVNWTVTGGQHAVVASANRRGVRRERRAVVTAADAHTVTIVAPVPRSASRPAKRDEIAGAGGAGRPPRIRR